MKRIAYLATVAALPIAALVAPLTATAVTTEALSPTWQSWQADALHAVSTIRDQGPVTLAALPGPISVSLVDTSSGPITIEQQSIEAQDGSGKVDLTLASLDGQQLTVTVAGASSATVLVLDPNGTTIQHEYQVPTIQTSSHHGRARVHLVTIGGCHPYAYPPMVIGSIFGPLVDGLGTINCSVTEDLAAIVSLYIGGTHVGATATGSDSGTYLGVNSFFSCSSGGPNTFHTAELWSVNGVVQGGTTSTGASLGCAA
ncbi:MAG TPA: hypothetical protein VHB02_17425 [Acidimicrobiales bacterium]|nr:hypothetical protein [Acidimicrobiales bacterium]